MKAITADWANDGYVYLTRGNQRRQIGQGSATRILASHQQRPSGLTENQLLWRSAHPAPNKASGYEDWLTRSFPIKPNPLPVGRFIKVKAIRRKNGRVDLYRA
jgi:hypothetical protein